MCARPLAGLDLRNLAHVFRRSLQDLQDRFPLVARRTAVLLNEYAVFFSCSCFWVLCVFPYWQHFSSTCVSRVWMFLLLQIISVIAAFCCHWGFFFLLRSFCVFVCFWGLGNFCVCSIWQFVAHLPVGITSIAFLSHGLHSNYNQTKCNRDQV